MRTIILLILSCFIVYTTQARVNSNMDDILGIWQMENGTLQVEVFKKEGKYFGKITWVKDQSKKGSIGQLVLWNLVYDAESSEWNNGEIRLPEMNHSASCYLKLINKDTIIATGYHGLRMFGKDAKFNRLK